MYEELDSNNLVISRIEACRDQIDLIGHQAFHPNCLYNKKDSENKQNQRTHQKNLFTEEKTPIITKSKQEEQSAFTFVLKKIAGNTKRNK